MILLKALWYRFHRANPVENIQTTHKWRPQRMEGPQMPTEIKVRGTKFSEGVEVAAGRALNPRINFDKAGLSAPGPAAKATNDANKCQDVLKIIFILHHMRGM